MIRRSGNKVRKDEKQKHGGGKWRKFVASENTHKPK